MCLASVLQAAVAAVPEGFVPVCTTSDLAGWREQPGEGRPTHWRVHDGILMADGAGPCLTSDRDYGDLELHIEWMRPLPTGRVSVALPGDARVTIAEPSAPGSGRADAVAGTWHTLLVRLQDGRMTVVRDDREVAEHRPPRPRQEDAPVPAVRGVLRIEAQGGPLHVRNLAVRELGMLDGSGPGWRHLDEDDFVDVNGDAETWTWKDGTVHCTGKPTGVIRTRRPLTNFEIAAEWRHLKPGGNSGFFLWSPPETLEGLPRDKLPAAGIEVQALDHAFTAQYEKATGKKATWFRTDGDVFPVGTSRMRPFPPVSPDGRRSFPSARHSRGSPEWNRYYVRAIDGEVRLWVNGHEVSGGTDCRPATGFLCLESEGAPVEFRRLRIRELPDSRGSPAAATPQ